MAVPDYQTFMLPLLRFASDDNDHTLAEARTHLASEFGLSEEDLTELLPSGRQTVFSNRIAWAKTYLKNAGILGSPKRGVFHITDRGKALLADNPKSLRASDLERFEAFREFRSRSAKTDAETDTAATKDELTPTELLDSAVGRIRHHLEQEILETIKSRSPELFEHLVVDLMVKMGYGGSRADAAQAVGRSGDEGIDGVIREDRLGLDVIYLQAKKWDGTVGRPELQKFVGALHGKRARKGVFLTTGKFASGAVEYVQRIDARVILIDGSELARLMIDHNLGVSVKDVYEVKVVDSDYFVED
jgi:restriction system protein